MERYAAEITQRLDDLVDPVVESVYLVVPTGTFHDFAFRNIRVIETGRLIGGNLGGYLWEQIWFARFLLSHKADGYLPLNFVPVLKPDVVVTIHDGNALSHPEFYPTVRKRLYRVLASVLLRVARRRSSRILTVSHASRDELVDRCNFNASYVAVAPPGVDHITEDASRTAMNVPEPFYLALSSATYNKNFEWVLETAVANPNQTFLIAGKGDFDAILKSHGYHAPPANVRHLGYVSDEQRNWLYSRCAAFLFPSRYEGFGLPPLEAACLGAPVIVSDIPPMREIFGDGFRYINPDVPATDLQAVTNCPDVGALRAEFSWTASAVKILAHLRRTHADKRGAIVHGKLSN
ncbi:glycosyltransferase family 4 protein [Mycolicibacterium fluoranthenivorans]|uniref:Glycosyltransferase involved in cell wall biosynthesis n=1 Tax=Mycolicibacterium fluoranthenivorans TaxID=258505 RepID=A0A7X5TVS5_9MYCO|nr:glycosyltransferase family 1 protein [Mycolicibacterium fluoranthenivorans]MCV7359270.1 glycosyltransferase family 4 protein [Mycolicibacterium fluoranthenivorans]NIH93646.1 glycosyltransferase involved in cell wall biosynthesis [Mycolicibacterium fluoranthenivorans]